MDQQYTRRLEKIEKVLERWLPEHSNNEWAEMVFPGVFTQIDQTGQINLLLALTAPGKDLLSRGGKRWRPLLMTLVCEALGGGDAALPLSPLVEFSHNASLIHDDIEDNSDERRGKPAVHKIYGVDAAINSGSFLYFLAAACIDSADFQTGASAALFQIDVDNCHSIVYSLWAAYLRKLHLGQAMDIHWHRNFDVIPSLDEYFTMCTLKTGCLARFAAELGAAAAKPYKNVETEKAQAIYGAAEKLGIGFQILDDVKNLTIGIPGKQRGDDIVEGKKSLPILLFMHKYPEKRELVFRCFTATQSGGINAPETEELIQALQASGVLAEAEEKGRTIIAEARETFAGISALLAGLVDLIA